MTKRLYLGLCLAATWPALALADDKADANAVIQLIQTIATYLRVFAYTFSVLMFVYAGILYFSGSTNPANPTKVKGVVQAVIIGLSLVILSELIVRGTIGFVSSDAQNQSGISAIISAP